MKESTFIQLFQMRGETSIKYDDNVLYVKKENKHYLFIGNEFIGQFKLADIEKDFSKELMSIECPMLIATCCEILGVVPKAILNYKEGDKSSKTFVIRTNSWTKTLVFDIKKALSKEQLTSDEETNQVLTTLYDGLSISLIRVFTENEDQIDDEHYVLNATTEEGNWTCPMPEPVIEHMIAAKEKMASKIKSMSLTDFLDIMGLPSEMADFIISKADMQTPGVMVFEMKNPFYKEDTHSDKDTSKEGDKDN